MSDRQTTCEERIDARLAGRAEQLGDLAKLARGEENADAASRLETAGEIVYDAANPDWDAVQEAAQDRAWETPLAVSKQTVYRVELSYGGPQDYFDVFTDAVGDVTRIEYRFLDWFDGASRTVSGDDFDALADYARQVIPGLME